MFLFARLVLAHLIGDFLFQFDRVHALKVKSKLGLLLHVSIVVSCLIIFVGPYLDQIDIWLLILFLGTTHYIQDWAKIKFTGQSNKQLIPFCIDQIFHVAFISVVLFEGFRTLGPPPNPDQQLLLSLYSNDAVILYFITALIASYAGHYIILLYKLDYLNINSTPSVFEKWYGFMERILVISVFFLGHPWPALIPVILAVRPLLYRAMMDRLSLSDQFSSKADILLTGTFSIITGLILYTLI
jgi:hypothetical protein